MGKPDQCVICMEDIGINQQEIYFNKCTHGKYCHKNCIIKCNYTCPICRAKNIIIMTKEEYNKKSY